MEQKRYKLRKWKESDAKMLSIHLNNKKIWDNCRDGLPYPYTETDAQAFIKHTTAQSELSDFCIEVDNESVGNIGFIRKTDVERYNAEIGYWLSETHWNKGIMTAALRDAINQYFQLTDVIRLHAQVYECNTPSMHVLEKVGFRKVGIHHKACFKNNRFINAHYYELLKENIRI